MRKICIINPWNIHSNYLDKYHLQSLELLTLCLDRIVLNCLDKECIYLLESVEIWKFLKGIIGHIIWNVSDKE